MHTITDDLMMSQPNLNYSLPATSLLPTRRFLQLVNEHSDLWF